MTVPSKRSSSASRISSESMSRWLVARRGRAVRFSEHDQEQLQETGPPSHQGGHGFPDLLVAEQEAPEHLDGVALVHRPGVAHEAQRRGARRRFVVLRKVPDIYGGSSPALTLRRREDPGEELREHALAGAVGPTMPRRSPRSTVRSMSMRTGSSWKATPTSRKSMTFLPPLALLGDPGLSCGAPERGARPYPSGRSGVVCCAPA